MLKDKIEKKFHKKRSKTKQISIKRIRTELDIMLSDAIKK
jgi:hypothetical protein